MKNKKAIQITILSLLSIFAVGGYIYKKYEASQRQQILDENRKLMVKDYSPVFGNPDAPVEIVEFLDPECETCRKFYPLVKELINEFPGKIKLVIRYAPFHQNAIFAARILEASRKQNKYWETMELLFERQPEWGSHQNPRPELIWTYLPEIGLDVEQIRTDMDDREILYRIQTDINDLRTLDVRATPTFFVNGQSLERFGYDELRNLVIKELDR